MLCLKYEEISYITYTFVFFISVAFVFPVIYQHIEQPHRKYGTYDQEIFVGNWIPDIFPKDITNIHEQHDVDTNEVWVKFNYGRLPPTEVLNSYTQVLPNDLSSLKLRKPLFASWWFDDVSTNSRLLQGHVEKICQHIFY